VTVPYGLVVRGRNALYDAGWLARTTLPARVISIGNLTAGGTGKTPVVIWLVNWLLGRGCRVGVLSRGYKRRSGTAPLLVADGQTVLTGPEDAGDEPFLIAQRCPGAVVAVGADRARLGRWVLERFPLQFMILDDGFQHRRLHRDLDVLIVDASDPDGLRALLPAGRLREPLSAAVRADAIVLTRSEEGDADAVLGLLRASMGRDPQAIRVELEAEDCREIPGGAVQTMDQVRGRRALVFSGIGNAASFDTLLRRHGVRVVEQVRFRDHHAYRKADLEAIFARAAQAGADVLITTEKDAVKLQKPIGRQEPLLAVRLGVTILDGRDRLERLILGEAP
jgi:tetraacyldisaccharide 4'-kinase